ncbi:MULTISPECIES: HD-GYP domain-containing protein [Burkholderiaceae]|uniref:GGDEF domain n=1 Tax=Caballeronia sordidicola TaxID=196367 RepID=A0A242N6Q2_CABSO|nr:MULTISPECIES: DUF3391 domain-containing protein [Burkholderiaceae]AME27158.2 hypothetical protein AXG89_24870 [Burkholderia sp. PAMC 26561]AME27693.2 hypothetical protein AXG89_27825 [Burkholderia sp. PAMC 26561]OTP79298.1 GGDEF domain [Caballeronia sordidicola]
MLKKISVSSLRAGMFMQALDGSWLGHPFWKRCFLLRDDDIRKIVASGIKSVVIDTDKGLDDDTLTSVTGRLSPGPDLGTEQPGESAPAAALGITRALAPWKSVAGEIEHAKRLFVSASAQMKLVFRQTRMGKAVLTTVIMPLVEAISASVIRNPHALTSVAQLKQHDLYLYAFGRSLRVDDGLACKLELDEQTIREAGAAGLMHDIGKSLMRLNVLNKAGKVTAEELEIAKTHPEDGRRLLQCANVSASVLQVALHHHEKFDGSGYPHKLRGDDIPLLAHMATSRSTAKHGILRSTFRYNGFYRFRQNVLASIPWARWCASIPGISLSCWIKTGARSQLPL